MDFESVIMPSLAMRSTSARVKPGRPHVLLLELSLRCALRQVGGKEDGAPLVGHAWRDIERAELGQVAGHRQREGRSGRPAGQGRLTAMSGVVAMPMAVRMP